MNQDLTPIIPNEYVIRRPRDEMGGQRTITVRKYSTAVTYERTTILSGLALSSLIFGNEFGVIERYEVDSPDHNIRALCGLVGERNLVLLSQQTNRPDYFRIKNVLLATLVIEFSVDQASGKHHLCSERRPTEIVLILEIAPRGEVYRNR
jgi:hypothetical protein